MRPFFYFLSGAALMASVAAHSIHIGPHGRECFHETLHKEDRMTVSYQVGDREFGSAGNLEIDFWVRGRDAVTMLFSLWSTTR